MRFIHRDDYNAASNSADESLAILDGRAEHPGVYEAYTDLEAGAWTKIKIEVGGNQGQSLREWREAA